MNDVLDRVSSCIDSLDRDKGMYDEVELVNGVGCCILSKFNYCVRKRVEEVCSRAASNITATVIDRMSLFASTDCKKDVHHLPDYPSVECDNIMLPGSRFEGLLGLIISVSLFSLIVSVFVFAILCISRRQCLGSNGRNHNSYQAL